jgi:hypothetical protein
MTGQTKVVCFPHFVFSFFSPLFVPLSLSRRFYTMDPSGSNPTTPVRQVLRRVDTPGAPARHRTRTRIPLQLQPVVLFPSASNTSAAAWSVTAVQPAAF